MHYFNSKSKNVFKVILFIIKHYFCKVAMLSLIYITYKVTWKYDFEGTFDQGEVHVYWETIRPQV